MRRFVPVLVLSIALAACGGGNKPSSQPTTQSPSPTPSPTPVTLERAKLDATLLAAADMGSGWTGNAPEDPEDDDATPGPTPVKCDLDEMNSRLPDALYGREVVLTNIEEGVFVVHTVETMNTGDAAKGFAEISSTMSACPTLTTTDDEGKRETVRQAPFTAGPYGDETIAITLNETTTPAAGEEPFAMGIIVFRRGDVVVTMIGFSDTVPTAHLTRAAQKALEKLDAALAGNASTGTPSASAS